MCIHSPFNKYKSACGQSKPFFVIEAIKYSTCKEKERVLVFMKNEKKKKSLKCFFLKYLFKKRIIYSLRKKISLITFYFYFYFC